MKFKLVFIFILFSLLGYSQEAPVPSPKILIKVPLGESTLIKNHTISFIKVIEDSRCPKGANCMWAGRAKVLVEISSEEKETIQKEIVFGKLNLGESDDLELFQNNNKKIVAYQLNPYPTSEYTPDSNKDVLLIAVEN